MLPEQATSLTRAWYKWKALRLPWRRKFLVGLDLRGNTYWEFRLTRGDHDTGRWRRIVEYPRGTHYGEVVPPPQWHQWLRHLRDAPPTLQEQRDEVHRQQRIKVLAAEADARWEAKPRLVDGPDARPPAVLEAMPAASGSGARHAVSGEAAGEETVGGAIASGGEQTARNEGVARKEVDPWKQHRRTGPSEDWQPQGWTPPASRR